MIHIYHHFDADGYAAAAVIGGYLLSKKYSYHDLKFISVSHYNKMPDLDTIQEDEKVFILDYSFSRDDDQEALLELYQNVTKNIIWIDHHESSKKIINSNEIFKTLAENGLVMIDKYAGCMLSWFWICARIRSDNLNTSLMSVIDPEKDYNSSPMWVRMVSDYDAWQHKLPSSTKFVKGCSNLGLRKVFIGDDPLQSFIWLSVNTIFANNRLSHELELTNAIIERGKTVLEIEEAKNKSIIKSRSFEVTLKIQTEDATNVTHNALSGEYTLLCVNSDGNSMTFGKEFEKYPACVIFTFDGNQFNYSIFSRKENGLPCNIIAEYFKKTFGITGGGHAHAAGWSSRELIFRKGCDHTLSENDEEIVYAINIPKIYENRSVYYKNASEE